MRQRIITALIAAALFVPVVVIGGPLFALTVYALAFIGLFEMLRMRGISLASIPGALAALCLAIFLIPPAYEAELLRWTHHAKIEWIFIAVVLLLSYTVVVKNKYSFEEAAFTLLSIFYVGIGFFYMIETRAAGLAYLVLALVIVWSTDSGAYFIGRAYGRHKLWPDISPNKTIEGFLGGIAVSVVAVSIYIAVADIDRPIYAVLAMAIVASVFGQFGDLVESAIKRHYGAKDSGRLLPGHGGILDRFDSLLFALPLLHFFHFI